MKDFRHGLFARLLSLILVCSLTVACFGTAAQARFISPDTWDPTMPGVGTNRYAYSGNDPVNKSDPNGHLFSIAVGIGIAIGAAISFFSGTTAANAPGKGEQVQSTSDSQVMLNMTAGAAGGTLVGRAAGAVAQDVFGKKQENIKQTTETIAGLPKSNVKAPGRVQSRINLEKEGWQHVLDRHFSDKNASQFSLSREELRSLLQDKTTVETPVSKVIESASGPRFVRSVETGRIVGYDKFNNFAPTSRLTVMTDRAGNLVSAFPGDF